MANWKQAPDLASAATTPGDAAAVDAESGFAFDFANWGVEGWSHVNVAGIGIPFEALALPIPIIGLYLVFRSLYFYRGRRVRKEKSLDPLPEMPVKQAATFGQ